MFFDGPEFRLHEIYLLGKSINLNSKPIEIRQHNLSDGLVGFVSLHLINCINLHFRRLDRS